MLRRTLQTIVVLRLACFALAEAQSPQQVLPLSSSSIEPFGLQDKIVKALAVAVDGPDLSGNPLKLFAGTLNDGVFGNHIGSGSNSWISLGLTGKNIAALDLQQWGIGPMDGLTLFAGVTGGPDTAKTALLYRRELVPRMDSTWSSADSGIDRTMTGSIEAITSFWFEGHTTPQPLIAGGYSGIYQSPFSIDWQKGSLPRDIWIHDVEGTPRWFGDLAWAVGSPRPSVVPIALKSTDKGSTWSVHYLPYALSDDALSIAINPRSPDTVYIGYLNGLLLMSPDGGQSWESTSLQQYSVRFTAVAVHPESPEHVFVGGSRMDNRFALYHSSDGGATWTEVFPPAGEQPAGVSSLAVIDTGTTTRRSFVFIGTYGTGVWRYSPGIVTGIETTGEHPHAIHLHQNYPNPFNPVTEIRYQISEVSLVTLKVFDVLGREVATLANDEKEAGTYRVRWDAAELSSGLYMYRLKANGFVETKKMILAR